MLHEFSAISYSTVEMALMNNQKKTCYVGGLADEVDESVIRAAFIPFGDISEVNQINSGFSLI